MNEDQAVSALGALAHTQRLRVFRALVVAGPEGLTPSVLADQLDVARNSLSFHLKELAHAGLVTIEQQGRNLIYRADFAQMNSLLGYMTEHCCQGGVCEVNELTRRAGIEAPEASPAQNANCSGGRCG